MNRTAATVLGLSLAGFLLPSCVQTDLNAPPNLRLGRDECIECGMIISEDRCSAAMVLNNEGVREPALFDDIGCMLDYAREHPEKTTPTGFVHDHSTRAWVPLDKAWFALIDETKIKTPMGSGIVAFGRRPDAESLAAAYAGTVIDYASLPAARKAWMEARYGSPDRAPIGASLSPTGGDK